MRRTNPTALALAERLCRPQRIGAFGHRGVGKTTLLTMLYREAVSGRLPELRLAAADTRTAEYLSDKVVQLESGRPLAATLAETELRFHLYHQGARLDLLVKDYQGEHVELGRDEPIREFLRDCDAVWLCLDAATVATPAAQLQRQQEVEQLVEDYLAAEPTTAMERPVAIVMTKADLFDERAASVGPLSTEYSILGTQASDTSPAPSATYFGMTQHALASHCPRRGCFSVSSLGRPDWARIEEQQAALEPRHLAEPLVWLASMLQAQDEARLDRLWTVASGDLGLLQRCVDVFARRYPEAPETAHYRQRLRALRRQRTGRRSLTAAVMVASLFALVWAYDVLGHQQTLRFEAEHNGDPAAALRQWQTYQRWHPTRVWFRSRAVRDEEQHLLQLQLAELRQRANDPDAEPETAWQRFQEIRTTYPEVATEELGTLRNTLKARRDEQARRLARQAFDQFVHAEHTGADLAMLAAQADQFLRDFPDSEHEAEVRRRRAACLHRLDERDIEAARAYSARQPFNYQTRREHYQRYLDKHPAGAFAREAETALQAIEADWDKRDFRAVRDHYLERPGDIPEIVARCRSYLAVHPQGRFAVAAADLLRWTERVTAPHEYRVVLRSGQFEKRLARWLSRGPTLSVELEVAGVRYGPSTIAPRSYTPEWDFEFPRPIRWKFGDPVRIRVTDHVYWNRVVLDIATGGDDPLAMRWLAGEVWSGGNRLTFESDFAMPVLPKIE
jgi:hypothetical protein